MNKEKIKLVLPGDFIATEEEFAPGTNTHEKDGEIKASIIGIADFDQQTKEAKVKGKTILPLKEGDIIIGRVVKVNEKMASINILSSEQARAIIISTGQIPVRNASQSYTEDMRKCFGLGDYVKAKVVMASRLAIDLATNEKGLGVVEAYCKNCRNRMEFNKDKMICLKCGSVEERKWFEAEDQRTERPRNDSRGFGDRRGNFGRSMGRDNNRRSFSGNRQERRPSFGREPNRNNSNSPPRNNFGRPNTGERTFNYNRSNSQPNSSLGRNNFNRTDSRGGFRNENRNNNSRQRRY
jgi:exosome complex component CSL4